MCNKPLQAYWPKTPTIHHLSHFFLEHLWVSLGTLMGLYSSVAWMVWDDLTCFGAHLGWLNGWDGWVSLHVPFTLDSSKCDLRIPREPVPRTSTHQASSCMKCGDASLIKVGHMANQWLTVEGDYTRTWK